MRRSFHLDSAQQIEFGKYLKALREAAGKTQAEVAEAVGISIGYVSTLESGTRNPPTPPVLAKIAKVYKVDESKMKSAAGYFNENKLGNLDRARIDWAFETACRDPEFKYGEYNLYKPMALETKAFIVELYEKGTGRILFSEKERQNLEKK